MDKGDPLYSFYLAKQEWGEIFSENRSNRRDQDYNSVSPLIGILCLYNYGLSIYHPPVIYFWWYYLVNTYTIFYQFS